MRDSNGHNDSNEEKGARTIVQKEAEYVVADSRSELSEGMFKNTVEIAIKKAMDEILEKRAFNATQLRAERCERYAETERIYNLLARIGGGVEEEVNTLIAFWQEQAYMQGMEDSEAVKNELKKYGIH